MVQSLNLSTALNSGEAFEHKSFREAPLTALSLETFKKLSSSLNNLKIIHSDGGYERDWRGLASLAEQRNKLDDQLTDPLRRVIDLWCENKPNTATFGNLIRYLELIDRWHVIEDFEQDFLKDFQNYRKENQQKVTSSSSKSEAQKIVKQENQIVQLPATSSEVTQPNYSSPTIQNETLIPNNYESESKVLTSDDVHRFQQGLALLNYDAFLLYADADYNYALEILINLQNNPLFNMQLCLKDDLLFGIPFEHIALMDLIRERCKFLIVILTKEFTKSSENRFLVNYAQALQIKQEIRKLIPLIYDDQVEVPANLAMFSRMRYNPNRTQMYWSKLADSMQLVGMSPMQGNFQRSIVSRRPQPRNLAHFGIHLKAKSTSSSLDKKVMTKTRSSVKRNRKSSNEFNLKTSNEFETTSYDSCSSSDEINRGFIRKLFCCS